MFDDHITKAEVDVGVILPCFNSSKTISRAFDSICNQTVKVKVVYIYDDGSNDLDKLLSIIKSYEKKLNIKLHASHLNHGPSMARNYFLGSSEVKYFAFLDSDDIWFKNKIECQYNFMEANNACLTGHSYIPFYNNNFNDQKNLQFRKLNLTDFFYGSPLFTPTIMIKNYNLRSFNYNFRTSEDWLFCLENIILNSWENECYFIINKMAAGFKQPIGYSGAGASIQQCHRDRIRALKHIKKISRLNYFHFIIYNIYENFKFPLRYINYLKNRLFNL